MKRNVDLTENGDFSRLFHFFVPKLEQDEFLEDEGAILQGNAEHRKAKRITNSFGSCEICDRC